MIRIKKSLCAPASLSTSKQYDGEDVKEQLMKDQHEKCYICERKLVTDFEIEHFKSASNYPHLIQTWENLFLACGYCNRRKSDSFDNNVNPLTTNVEEEISQRINFLQNKAEFTSSVIDVPHTDTIKLLNILYNGKDRMKPRNLKEEKFFNYAKQKIINFMRIINDYMVNPTEKNRRIMAEELSLDKELLGFKYWVICDNHLVPDFENVMVWNR